MTTKKYHAELNTEFDQQFGSKIEHYGVHPEMIPYVGVAYNKYKILVVSESHYVPEKFDEKNMMDPMEFWYDNPSIELMNEMDGNTDTRLVIDAYFNPERKAHRIFLNLLSALEKSNQKLDLTNIAWYNFYQKPARHKSEFKALKNSIDPIKALEVFEGVVEILQPSLIIFVSKNAFGNLGKLDKSNRVWDPEINGHRYKDFKTPIRVVPHPNSSWWSRKHGKGKEEGKTTFINIINEFIN